MLALGSVRDISTSTKEAFAWVGVLVYLSFSNKIQTVIDIFWLSYQEKPAVGRGKGD